MSHNASMVVMVTSDINVGIGASFPDLLSRLNHLQFAFCRGDYSSVRSRFVSVDVPGSLLILVSKQGTRDLRLRFHVSFACDDEKSDRF